MAVNAADIELALAPCSGIMNPEAKSGEVRRERMQPTSRTRVVDRKV
jgi:hypothetical protein